MISSLGGVNFGNVNFVIVRSFDRDRIKEAVSIVQKFYFYGVQPKVNV